MLKASHILVEDPVWMVITCITNVIYLQRKSNELTMWKTGAL